MRKVVVLLHLALDGVMQAPGRPDEDVRGGFARGGWALLRGNAMGVVDVHQPPALPRRRPARRAPAD